jgi:release factor glutamine methyltransferase
VDKSTAAVMVARGNAARLGLERRAAFVAGDWASALTGGFDLILANPPYVRRSEIAGLQKEVAEHEPRLALDGGEDGLDAYRRIAAEMPRLLRPGGAAVVEVGRGQWGAVAGLFRVADLPVAVPAADLAGVERCVICHGRQTN